LPLAICAQLHLDLLILPGDRIDWLLSKTHHIQCHEHNRYDVIRQGPDVLRLMRNYLYCASRLEVPLHGNATAARCNVPRCSWETLDVFLMQSGGVDDVARAENEVLDEAQMPAFSGDGGVDKEL
jgi:hypothetical protein